MPAPSVPPVLTVADAAARKGCTAQAIRNAVGRGDLHAVRLGARATLVIEDAAFAAWAVKETGGRAHRTAVVQ